MCQVQEISQNTSHVFLKQLVRNGEMNFHVYTCTSSCARRINATCVEEAAANREKKKKETLGWYPVVLPGLVVLKFPHQHCRRPLVEFFPGQKCGIENVNQSLQATWWYAAMCQFHTNYPFKGPVYNIFS